MAEKLRSEINKQYTWSLDSVYTNEAEITKEINLIEKEVVSLVALKGQIAECPTNLLVVTNLYHKICRKLEKLYVYHSHMLDTDHGNGESQATLQKTKNLYVQTMSKIAFVIPEILSADQAKISEFILADQYLKEYEKFFKDLQAEQKYVLSDSEEKIMSMTQSMSSSTYEIYSTLTNADLKFADITDSTGKKIAFDESKWSSVAISEDVKLRKSAFQSLLHAYSDLENTFASLYINHVKSLVFKTNVRGYDNPRQMALFNNQIDEKIYDTLVDITNENLYLNHRYLELKKAVLKYDELNMYDMYVPLISGVDREYDYTEAKKHVYNASAVLGDEYQEIIKRAFNEKWIDVYPNKGKRGGAYSGGSYDSKPFVLLNYTNKLNDVFTLAHELGHSGHTYLTNKNQPYQYSHYKIFVAEVASIVNELLLFDYLVRDDNTSKKQKVYLLNYFLDQFRATVYRQTMFAEFEAKSKALVFNNQDVNGEILNNLYYELNKNYFGSNVNINEEIKYEWMRIPHFYMNYYVYQYATSYMVALKVTKEILEGNQAMKENYLEFLKLGDSIKPVDLIKTLGIDMTDRAIYDEAFAAFDVILSQLEKLYNSKE